MLVDADWQGQPRKLMLHADRNGFFYVFDRRDGKLLLAKPFVRNLTWASGIGADGRPIKLPNQEPIAGGHEGLSVAGRRDQLVLAVVQSGDRPLLRADVREVQHLHEERPGAVGERQVVSRRLAAHRARSEAAADPEGDRHPHRRDHAGSCRSRARRSRGAARSTTATGLVIFGEEGGALMAADAVDRQAAVELPDQPDLEGLADDLHVRRQAVHRRGGRVATSSRWRSRTDMKLLADRPARAARCQPAAPQFPQAEIANAQHPRARSTCPTRSPATTAARASTGRASIASLKWNGHEYFGQWFERYDPKIHDAITGPVEEFLTGDAGLGYAEAKPGEAFVRIGVGAVRKPDEPAYRRFATYEIVDPGKWTVNRGADWIEFVARAGRHRGYAYVYRKTLRLDQGHAGARAPAEEHRPEDDRDAASTTTTSSRSTASRPGPDVVVRFPFEPRAARPLNGLAEMRGKEIAFLRDVRAGGRPSSPRSRASARRRATTTSASRTARPAPACASPATGRLSKLLFWSAGKTVCPEPYIDAQRRAGQGIVLADHLPARTRQAPHPSPPLNAGKLERG